MENSKVIFFGILLMGFSSVAAIQKYQVKFDSLWNKKDHVARPGNAHFSPIVAVSHNEDFHLFSVGKKASKAIEKVAELGQVSLINQDIDHALMQGSIRETLNTQNLFLRSDRSQVFEIEISDSEPLLSFITMIAPSPDWVVGLSSLSLYDPQQGFAAEQSMDLFAYDAGTENGDFAGNFSINNRATRPQKTISRLKGKGFKRPFARVRITPIN